MRARRADYTASGQLIDIPYSSLESDDHPTVAKASPSALTSSVAVAESRNPYLDNIFAANSNVSAFSKASYLASRNLYPERKALLVPGISHSPRSREKNHHFERNSCNTTDRCASNDKHESKFGGRLLAAHPPDRFLVPIPGEYGKPCSEQISNGGDGTLPSFLQRQSSGSSFTDSLFSSDVPLSTVSPTISHSGGDSALLGNYLNDICKQDEAAGAMQECSWAQQTEQSYNLQLALALRLVAEAGLSEEPLLLPCSSTDNRQVICSAGASSVQATAFRFWVNGGLTYADRLDDGFYHIWGMNPHVWALCNHPDNCEGRIPTLNSLKGVNPLQSFMEVVVVDKHRDSRLCEMENEAFNLEFKSADSKELAELLGKLVSQNMGGSATTEQELVSRWQISSLTLKECLNSIVLPIGNISVGICRHRSLLFKALADSVNLPCRIARGCLHCGNADGFSCLVFCGAERELLVDLVCSPGDLSSPLMFLKSQTLPTITSPLHLPELNLSGHSGLSSSSSPINLGAAKGCELDWQNPSAAEQESAQMPERFGVWKSLSRDVCAGGRNAFLHNSLVGAKMPAQAVGKTREVVCGALNSHRDQSSHKQMPSEVININYIRQHADEKKSSLAAPLPESFTELDILDERQRDFSEETGGAILKARNLELSLALDGLDVAWDELKLKERIGAGSFGTVHRADWNGSDVAVKVFTEQDFFEERLDEFIREVAIMKRTRHPNVVLFMGAVTKHPNLSIVTEFLPRGSLFRLLHRRGMRELLDDRRCIRMALDVAKGVNYLHKLNPPIVHRDLKSPNLLVDKTWTVKVCDFGLSRLKAKTFLSSRSAAGTAEWMAPEVLRDEPSNEKCDVYSFGVILWEIFTLQQPWNGLSPAQVVGAVGFQHRRLHMPQELNPTIAALIESCWASDPRQRPGFTAIMESLKQLLSVDLRT